MKPLPMILDAGRAFGEEFIVWLWMRGIESGGTSGLDGDLSCCFVDDAVQLVTERGDVKNVSLRKGNPAESREAFEALARGLRPASAKFRLLSGDLEWSFTLSASTLEVSAYKLPTTASKDPTARAADRLFLMEEGVAHLERRLKSFLALRTKDPEGLQAAILGWLHSSLEPFQADAGGEDADEDDAPATGSENVAPLGGGVQKAIHGFMDTLAKHGAGVTVESGGRSVTITPEQAKKAAQSLKP